MLWLDEIVNSKLTYLTLRNTPDNLKKYSIRLYDDETDNYEVVNLYDLIIRNKNVFGIRVLKTAYRLSEWCSVNRKLWNLLSLAQTEVGLFPESNAFNVIAVFENKMDLLTSFPDIGTTFDIIRFNILAGQMFYDDIDKDSLVLTMSYVDDERSMRWFRFLYKIKDKAAFERFCIKINIAANKDKLWRGSYVLSE